MNKNLRDSKIENSSHTVLGTWYRYFSVKDRFQ